MEPQQLERTGSGMFCTVIETETFQRNSTSTDNGSTQTGEASPMNAIIEQTNPQVSANITIKNRADLTGNTKVHL